MRRERTYEGTRHDAGKVLVVIVAELCAMIEQVVRGLQIEGLLHFGVRCQQHVRSDHDKQRRLRRACGYVRRVSRRAIR